MTTYLVRLRYPFRFESSGEIWIERDDGHFWRLFGTPKAARQFTHHTLPVWLNPFGPGAQVNIHNVLTVHHNMGVEDKCLETLVMIPLKELHERASSTTLEPLAEADCYDQGNWQAWWELVTETMTWPEQARLRRSLGVLPWVFNPFDYRFAWVYEESLCFQPFRQDCEMGWVVPGLRSLGLNTPDFQQPLEAWQKWWANEQEAMSDETRDLVWWLLMPYPYQIIEVELEVGR